MFSAFLIYKTQTKYHVLDGQFGRHSGKHNGDGASLRTGIDDSFCHDHYDFIKDNEATAPVTGWILFVVYLKLQLDSLTRPLFSILSFFGFISCP